MTENTAGKQRRRSRGRPFKPGQSGNPAGKPKGARHNATLLAEHLLTGEAADLTRVVIDLAKKGNVPALRLCLERILPSPRDRPVMFQLPFLDSAADASKATGAIVAAVAKGELTPLEAADLARLVEVHVKAIEAGEFERRLRLLEERDSDETSA
jgi:hypothetical protein